MKIEDRSGWSAVAMVAMMASVLTACPEEGQPGGSGGSGASGGNGGSGAMSHEGGGPSGGGGAGGAAAGGGEPGGFCGELCAKSVECGEPPAPRCEADCENGLDELAVTGCVDDYLAYGECFLEAPCSDELTPECQARFDTMVACFVAFCERDPAACQSSSCADYCSACGESPDTCVEACDSELATFSAAGCEVEFVALLDCNPDQCGEGCEGEADVAEACFCAAEPDDCNER